MENTPLEENMGSKNQLCIYVLTLLFHTEEFNGT